MKLIDAFKAGHKLLTLPTPEVAYPRGVGAIYPSEWGIVLVDPDWDQNDTGKVVHFIDGDELGKGPWVVGDAYFDIVKTTHDLYRPLAAWYERRKSDQVLYEREKQLVAEAIELRKNWNKPDVDLPT